METHDEPLQRPEIAGYDTKRCLGAGGTGVVWVLQETCTGDELVVKILGYDEPLRTVSPRRLGLHHEFLVQERGVVDSSQGPGILMEYCPAGSAAAVVAARGPLAVGEVLTVIAPIAEALEFLHEQGVTHGDVSPRNILFTAEGKPKLGDFGNHAARGETPADYGTNGFCAPEMARAAETGELEPARDIYALAACTWYLLTGRAPALAENRIPIGAMVPAVNDELAILLEDGLAVDPTRRPSAGQFAQRIFSGGEPAAVELGSPADPEALKHMVTTRQALPKRARVSRSREPGTGEAALDRSRTRRRKQAGPKAEPTPHTPSAVRAAGFPAHFWPRGSGRTPLEKRHRTHSPTVGKRPLLIAGLLGILLLSGGTIATQSIEIPISRADGKEIEPPGAAVDASENASAGEYPPGAAREPDGILLAAADLTLRRDRSLMARDADALKEIHIPGSPSMERDVQMLTLMERNRLTLESLQTTIEDALLVALGQNDSAFVEATSKQGGYRYVDGSGNAIFTVGDMDRQTVNLELRHDGKSWKIWDVHAVPAGKP